MAIFDFITKKKDNDKKDDSKPDSSAKNNAGEEKKSRFKERIEVGNREVITDFYIASNASFDYDECNYKVFVRLNGINKKIANVTFKHCIFDSCYLKSCVFDTCNFEGCKFIACNLHKSTFPGSSFEYTTFERTHISDEILTINAPKKENLRMKFARSLRMNFQQLGDADAVNKAIAVELDATKMHLYNGWHSSDEYYRTKYPGSKRISQLFKWIKFKALDSVWGNGESVRKLTMFFTLIVLLMGIYDNYKFNNPDSLLGYIEGIKNAFCILFGLKLPVGHVYSDMFMVFATVIRLTLFGFFTAILVKRLGRR